MRDIGSVSKAKFTNRPLYDLNFVKSEADYPISSNEYLEMLAWDTAMAYGYYGA